MMKKIIFLLVLMFQAASVNAEGSDGTIDAKRIYAGGGLSFNNLSGVGSSNGFQFFGGYEFAFKLNDDISTSVELGYMDSGKFDRLSAAPKVSAAKGMWLAAVESVPLSNKIDMLVRLGYDFGDDDGLLIGTGVRYKFTTKVAMRMEYVARQHVSGLQADVLFKF